MSQDSVIPLESNPEIFTDFGRKLGLSPLLAFSDIYSVTDPDLVAFLPRPIYALILLFPVTEQYEALKDHEEAARNTEKDDHFENIVWFKQLLRNGCGLYGLLHALCNLPPELRVGQSRIEDFVTALKSLPNVTNSNHFEEKSKLVKDLSLALYQTFSKQGQTEAPSADEDVNLHFICFTKGTDGHYYELDGRRNGPVDLGPAEEQTDPVSSPTVIHRVQKYMSLADEDNSLHFAMMGLGPDMN
ncbi:hypothetical protein OGAPHI_000681 [Ogataea philodendri]|uniref:Ubiquitin carboxyl-terminal hydrolase n=1 Tax=Ogataea philodendri TaxID=1378263 RepID=A0A9P8TA44_9ASCO|nr:uncharacterized protein OGAPHI_000681 [Ogataea philodendri]KAH3670970.1 hypothetical protein OGAPHI_000681 [Ogataea philodendri]